MIFPVSGLYAITAEHHSNLEQLALAVQAALRGGARLIQYRAKSAPDRLAEAQAALAECRAFDVPLIINDDVELALAIKADGVHLGKDDGSIRQAREWLGRQAIIGVSCYDSVERALEAERQGASYVAFGRFFPSASKPHAPCARLETLTLAKQKLIIPIVAIGGITPDNGRILLEAGADMLAVIDAVFGGDDPEQDALAFQPLFRGKSPVRDNIA
jgi:thiamine-phosphate pyrophosphorylase